MTVLVTRPQQRAASLCRLIEQAGGTALAFAAIEISEPQDPQSRDHARDNIDSYDVAVFISPTAVEQTIEYLGSLPAALKVAAIGSRTDKTLGQHGITASIVPDGHDSEALLEHEALSPDQIGSKNIVIFRGDGGRELLGETLRSRGANVDYANMYHRSLPSDSSQIDAMLESTDLITISSNEGLQNLYEISDKEKLVEHPLVVPGERGYNLALALGFSQITIADNATDEAVLNALKYAVSQMS